MPFATSSKIQAIHTFDQILQRGRWLSWIHWLLGRPSHLLSFEALRHQLLYTHPRDQGIQQIQIENIVGSVGRSGDFDHHFRPLKNSLKHRWIQLYNLRETVGWPPIEVYQVGDAYYLYDGHHRVSVARAAGATTIEAQVYEYPVPKPPPTSAPQLATIPATPTCPPYCSC